jgi:hypothetical protein
MFFTTHLNDSKVVVDLHEEIVPCPRHCCFRHRKSGKPKWLVNANLGVRDCHAKHQETKNKEQSRKTPNFMFSDAGALGCIRLCCLTHNYPSCRHLLVTGKVGDGIKWGFDASKIPVGAHTEIYAIAIPPSV